MGGHIPRTYDGPRDDASHSLSFTAAASDHIILLQGSTVHTTEYSMSILRLPFTAAASDHNPPHYSMIILRDSPLANLTAGCTRYQMDHVCSKNSCSH